MPLSARSEARHLKRFREEPKRLIRTRWILRRRSHTPCLMQVVHVANRMARLVEAFGSLSGRLEVHDIPVNVLTDPWGRLDYLGHEREFTWIRVGLYVAISAVEHETRVASVMRISSDGIYARFGTSPFMTGVREDVSVPWDRVNGLWRVATQDEIAREREQEAQRLAEEQERARREAEQMRSIVRYDPPEVLAPPPTRPSRSHEPIVQGPTVWEALQNDD